MTTGSSSPMPPLPSSHTLLNLLNLICSDQNQDDISCYCYPGFSSDYRFPLPNRQSSSSSFLSVNSSSISSLYFSNLVKPYRLVSAFAQPATACLKIPVGGSSCSHFLGLLFDLTSLCFWSFFTTPFPVWVPIKTVEWGVLKC